MEKEKNVNKILYQIKKLSYAIITIIVLFSCASIKKIEVQDTYNLINIVLNKEVEKKKDSINLLITKIESTPLYKMFKEKESKKYQSFKDFLSYHNIAINLDNEKFYFKEQMSQPLKLNLEKIDVKSLRKYPYAKIQGEKSKDFDIKFRKNSIYLAKPIFTKDSKYAIMYQKINDHIFYFIMFHKRDNTWEELKTYNSSRVIIDGVEVDLF